MARLKLGAGSDNANNFNLHVETRTQIHSHPLAHTHTVVKLVAKVQNATMRGPVPVNREEHAVVSPRAGQRGSQGGIKWRLGTFVVVLGETYGNC